MFRRGDEERPPAHGRKEGFSQGALTKKGKRRGNFEKKKKKKGEKKSW